MNSGICWGPVKTPTGGSLRPNSSRTMWGMCRLEWSKSLGVRRVAAWRGQTSWTVSSIGSVHSLLSSPRHLQTTRHPQCPKVFFLGESSLKSWSGELTVTVIYFHYKHTQTLFFGQKWEREWRVGRRGRRTDMRTDTSPCTALVFVFVI